MTDRPGLTADPPDGAVISRVMVVLQDSDETQAAATEGVALARAHGAEVFFVDIPEPPADTLVEGLQLSVTARAHLIDEMHRNAHHHQAAALGLARQEGVSAQTFSVASPHLIAQAAQSQSCDVIVVANTGHNAVVRLLIGDIVPMLITESSVPVLVCRAPGARPER